LKAIEVKQKSKEEPACIIRKRTEVVKSEKRKRRKRK